MNMKNNNHERLCAYLLGELDAADSLLLEAELESSVELRNEKDRIAGTIGLLRGTVSADEALSPELMATIERAARPIVTMQPWYLRNSVRVAAGMAAVALGIVGGNVLMPDPLLVGALDVPQEELAVGRRNELQDSLKKNRFKRSERTDEDALESMDEIQQDSNLHVPILENRVELVLEALPEDGAAVRDREERKLEGFGRSTGSRQFEAELGAEVSVSRPTAKPIAPAETGALLDGLKLPLRKLDDQAGGKEGNAPLTTVQDAGTYHLATGEWQNNPKGKSGLEFGLTDLASAKKSYRGPGDSTPPAVPATAKAGPEDFFLGRGEQAQSDQVSTPGFELHLKEKSADLEGLSAMRTKAILDSCVRRAGEAPSAMFFRFWGDNAFELCQADNLSTFAVDVDTASYTLARRYIMDGILPAKEQVRTEEFLNYFKPDIAAPTQGTFAIHTDLAPSLFGNGKDAESERWMMRVGIRGREVAREERKPLTLTFVIDTSGSMREGGRLELVKHSLRLLTAQLNAADSIAIVGFSSTSQVILPMTSAQNRALIEESLYSLSPKGGTNAERGLVMGYEVAHAALTPGAHNRVILLSDGVANLGQTDQDRINADVRGRRDAGIYLNTIGVGMSNHNDTFLEQLANKGDGICNYVDSAAEARRALVDNFTGAFEPIARDVKIQVEFDKQQVYRYRLLGYENRAIRDVDFRNDLVDAGEVGAGHQVVALYELEMTGVQGEAPLAKVHLRWKEPTGVGRDVLEDEATEVERRVHFTSATNWAGALPSFKRCVFVAQFAEILRRSVHARDDSMDKLIRETEALVTLTQDSDLVEFLSLLRQSRALIISQAHLETDLSRCVDEIRRNRILQAQYDDLLNEENVKVFAELERVNNELERRIRDLIRREVEAQQR
ncbi:MAG: Ca-activated chloride channel family protein [Planctomycetota bacterium]|jgi:Ca-activated chloride channel family protein